MLRFGAIGMQEPREVNVGILQKIQGSMAEIDIPAGAAARPPEVADRACEAPGLKSVVTMSEGTCRVALFCAMRDMDCSSRGHCP